MKPAAPGGGGAALSSGSSAGLNSPQVGSSHAAPSGSPPGAVANSSSSSSAGGGGGGGGAGSYAGYQLSPVEAFRAVVLIEEALRQLLFVSKLVPSSSANQNKNKLDELAISKGDEIVKMIKEQSLLEEK